MVFVCGLSSTILKPLLMRAAFKFLIFSALLISDVSLVNTGLGVCELAIIKPSFSLS